MRRRVIATLVLLAALVLLGVTTAARAHVPVLAPVEVVVTVASSPPAIPWTPFLTLAVLLILVSRSRRGIVGLFIVLLAAFAFEAGLHSVHHLGDEVEEARCVVAAATSNLSGTVGAPVALIGTAEADDIALLLESVALPRRSLRPYQGRAPPFVA